MSAESPHPVFLRKKWRHFASVLDYDKDGKVSREDHQSLAERAVAAGGIDPGSKQARQIHTKINQSYDDLFACIKNGEPATYEEVVDSLYARIDEFKRCIHQNTHAFFDMIDSNADGMIQLSEFRQYYYIFGLKAVEADQVFKMIDTDGDGVIDRNEFIDFVLKFFFLEDESHPSKNYVGILPE